MKKLYSKQHIWVEVDNGVAKIGVTDYAQGKLGTILFVNLPEEGELVDIDEKFGDIESVKTVSDLLSPVRGEVLRVNEELIDEPDCINEVPDRSWFAEIKVDLLSEQLMDESAYAQYRETL